MTENNQPCKNCGATMSDRFCAHCGQKQALPLETNRIMSDVWSQFVDFDFAFARSIRDLLLRPSALIDNYLNGQRKTYTNPFKLLFICATIYFLLVNFFGVKLDFITHSEANEANAKKIAALLNYLIFIILIPAAFFYRLLFRKAKLNFASSYVSLCYLWSLYLLAASVLIPLTVAIPEWYGIIRTLVGLLIIIFCVRQLYQLSAIRAIFSGLIFYVIYFVSTFLVMGIIISIAYLFEFKPLMISLPKG